MMLEATLQTPREGPPLKSLTARSYVRFMRSGSFGLLMGSDHEDSVCSGMAAGFGVCFGLI